MLFRSSSLKRRFTKPWFHSQNLTNLLSFQLWAVLSVGAPVYSIAVVKDRLVKYSSFMSKPMFWGTVLCTRTVKVRFLFAAGRCWGSCVLFSRFLRQISQIYFVPCFGDITDIFVYSWAVVELLCTLQPLLRPISQI